MAIVTRSFVKKVLGVTDSTYDERIDLFIPHAESDFEAIRGIPFDEDSNDIIQYPDNAELIASQMVGFLIKTNSLNAPIFSGMQSESIGKYSYQKEKILYGYPLSIVGKIERYQSAQ